MSMPDVPVLDTERLHMRGWVQDDFPAFAAVFADEEHCRYIGGSCSEDDAWRRFAITVGHWSLRGYGTWAVTRRDTGELVGSIGLWNPGGWPEIELGYWLTRAGTGQGFATEAGAAARRYAYEVLGLGPIVSFIHPDNHASQAVVRRLGARLEAMITIKDIDCQRWRHPTLDALTD